MSAVDEHMAKKDEEVNIMFYIPQNFTDDGKIFGMFKKRNLVEALVIGALPGYLLWTIVNPIAGMGVALMLVLFIAVPLFILGIVGINEDALTVFLQHVIFFFKNRKKMRFKRIRAYRTVQRVQGNAGVSGKKPTNSKATKGGAANGARSRPRK